MKDNGRQMRVAAVAWNAIQTVTDMKVSFSKVNHTVKESTHGRMEKCMRVNGPPV